ncbi:uncharacterized protein LAESUDRAFT_694503 [Laetiporus sulphureus 93-53]|uniref:Velvet domain-containing protein n=1 Tax=Laetiporus sulphureus 93-53 TaxID=1314785 RepID=A0A165G8L6_9APHY|nr:uncharacterized protein LAESUDRAFT_694503 [Laetiporus sulphureus 93-53]KZT09981.1 hypothetical protein LAESUDRAFT_694503 [Laetiporus sulphureus 93-53]
MAKASPSSCAGMSRSYALEIVQHPVRVAECGDATLSRLPVAPPPIVKLQITGDTERTSVDETDLPFLVAHLSLLNNEDPISGDADSRGQFVSQHSRLYGSLVSSPHILQNLQGKQGIYFLFPDVSVRQRGQYRLCVRLLRLPMLDTAGRFAMESPQAVLAQTRSLAFDVVSRSEYVAPAQTPLSQYFHQQGARMYSFARSTHPHAYSVHG